MFNREIFKCSKGQALVEMAIVLTLLLLLVFGVTEFGRLLYQKNNLTNAAREGARKAAVTKPWDEPAVKNHVISVSAVSLATNNVNVETIPATSPTNPQANYGVKVSVSTKFTSVVPNILPMFENYSIRATATMRYE